jgi:hypothetical protein
MYEEDDMSRMRPFLGWGFFLAALFFASAHFGIGKQPLSQSFAAAGVGAVLGLILAVIFSPFRQKLPEKMDINKVLRLVLSDELSCSFSGTGSLSQGCVLYNSVIALTYCKWEYLISKDSYGIIENFLVPVRNGNTVFFLICDNKVVYLNDGGVYILGPDQKTRVTALSLATIVRKRVEKQMPSEVS